MRNILLIGLAAVLAGLFTPTRGQAVSKQAPLGETYLGFIEVPQGARGAAVGDAYTGITDDVSSVFWNAAGLTAMAKNRFQFTFTNTQWIADMQLNSGVVGINTDFGAFAFSFVAFSTGDIEETTIFKPDGTGRMLDTGNWAIGAAYAKQFTDRMSVGGQFRVIQEKLDKDFSFRVFDLAVGTLYHTGFHSLRLAMALRNFGQDKTLLQDDQLKAKMPSFFNLAAAAEVVGTKEDPVYLTTAFELVYAVGFEERIHMGGELWLWNILALRGGYKWNYDSQGFTAGAGVRLQRGVHYLQADFAWVDFNGIFDAPLRFSVTGSF